jgi:hypothetical protein
MSQRENFDLEAMRSIDIRTVDPATLVDIREVDINPELPFEEKALEFIKQIRNPYCFKSGDTIIKITHNDTTATLNDNLEVFLRSL